MSRYKTRGWLQRDHRSRRAFTLVELLTVIAIIGILTSIALLSLFGVQDDAKERSTRATITRINEIVMARFESYRTRPVPIRIPPRTSPQSAMEIRLLAIRQLMRMEMPDRLTDVTDLAVAISDSSGTIIVNMAPPRLWVAYRRRAQSILGPTWAANWSTSYQGAECLYMILAAYRDGDSTGLDSIPEAAIGDVDGDGMPEIHDAWGKPIEFLRWAPGFRAYPGIPGGDVKWGMATVDDDGNGVIDDSAEAGWPGTDDVPSPSDIQSGNAVASPDFFDPMRVDYRWGPLDLDASGNPNYLNDPFVLYPLIYSAGRDRQYDIITDLTGGVLFHYNATVDSFSGNPYPNDPYFILDDLGNADPNDDLQIGKPYDTSNPPDGLNHADNITNHNLATGSQ